MRYTTIRAIMVLRASTERPRLRKAAHNSTARNAVSAYASLFHFFTASLLQSEYFTEHPYGLVYGVAIDLPVMASVKASET
jgi:hypothetical protein